MRQVPPQVQIHDKGLSQAVLQKEFIPLLCEGMTDIMSAIDVLVQYDQLLPEEYEDLRGFRTDYPDLLEPSDGAMIAQVMTKAKESSAYILKYLTELIHGPVLPQVTKDFICLVVNLQALDLTPRCDHRTGVLNYVRCPQVPKV